MENMQETYRTLRTILEEQIIADSIIRREDNKSPFSTTEQQICHNNYVHGLNYALETYARIVKIKHEPLMPQLISPIMQPLERMRIVIGRDPSDPCDCVILL